MKKLASAICLMLITFSGALLWAKKFPVNAQALGQIEYEAPDAPTDLKYLGISGKPVLRLTQIQADVLIIQVFNMYCHYCQSEAPNVNRLYQIIETSPTLKGKVKIVGIGVGNTPYEVNVFKKKFNVRFPLLSDPLLDIQKTSESRFRTPTFIVARKVQGPTLEIVYIHVGRLGSPEQFLDSFMSR